MAHKRTHRKTRKSIKGGFTLASLGQAASNLLVPMGLFYGVQKMKERTGQRSRSRRRY
jgi:hypothetical protein